MTRNTILAVPALALGLALAAVPPAAAEDAAVDPHHPVEGAAGAAMPQDLMTMCPMMATMMQQMMSSMMGHGMMNHGMMGEGMMPMQPAPAQPAEQQVAAADGPAAAAYRQANDAMMRAMMVPLTGEADRDFVQQMIAHHQGAIDMARIELQFGTDPQIRKLAEGIIAAQEKEIGEMNQWLADNPR